MTTTTTTTCDHKQPKLSVSDAMRARNGGKDGSLLPASASPDDGSDTENENDEETNQFYLSKMSDDTDRKTETVFGKGVEVWRSHGETVYADLTDKVKRKMREEELWDEEAKMKVETGLKRKMSDMKKEYSTKDIKTMDTTEKKEGDVTDPALPTEPSSLLQPTSRLPFPLPKLPIPGYRTRTPNDTQFRHGSAGIDPLGAYNRPIKPLPARHPTRSGITTQGISHTTYTTIPNKGVDASQHPGDPQSNHSTRPSRAFDLPSRSSRIVSGSFGSFDGGRPSRFDERTYRLGPGRGAKESGEKTLDLFKGKHWLR